MKKNPISPSTALIVMALFFISAILVLLKIIQDGWSTPRVIAAAAFAAAGILWTFLYIKLKQDTE
jgi:hypothetical protein